jgi:hypothetical protein
VPSVPPEPPDLTPPEPPILAPPLPEAALTPLAPPLEEPPFEEPPFDVPAAPEPPEESSSLSSLLDADPHAARSPVRITRQVAALWFLVIDPHLTREP